MHLQSHPRAHHLAGLLLLLTALGGCVGRESAPERAARKAIVDTALDQVGRPYRYGGDNPSGFDCSGLVHYSYSAAGYSVPRSSSELIKAGRHIRVRNVRPGDLLFYRFFDHRRATLHVALYIGEGQLVHAPSSGGEVETVDLDHPPWPKRFLTARRLLP